jgi:hypothetical protein
MAAKVNFNTTTKEIEVTLAPDVDDIIDLDVKVDIYSDGKEDWLNTPSLRNFRFPLFAVGGITTSVGKQGAIFVLKTPWKIKLYDADHELRLTGVLATEDGTRVWTEPDGIRSVAVIPAIPNDVVSTIPPTSSENAIAVWQESVTGNDLAGTFGEMVKKTSLDVLGIIGRLGS